MKIKLTGGVRALANGISTNEDKPIMSGVHVTKEEAVVADGFMLVIKKLQLHEMSFEVAADDGINSVVIPSDALKACKGEEITLQTIEAMKPPIGGLMASEQPGTKVVVRMDGADFSVEADSIEGTYPDYKHLLSSPFVGQIAISTKLIKKVLRTLPDDGMLQLRFSEPDKPIEFQCSDTDGDLPIRGLIMPMSISWLHTQWLTQDKSPDSVKD